MRRAWLRPAQIVPLAFLAAIAIGTALMMLPASRRDPGSAPLNVALFTTTSALCVVGLATVDTPTYWSDTGLALITVLTQVGGFGIVSLASVVGLVVSRRLGLRSRLMTQTESAFAMGDVRRILIQIALTAVACEAAITLILAARLWSGYDYSLGKALWYGLFHAVQAFNNGGLALYSDSLTRFVDDWWICLPLVFGVIVGGLGFPALAESVCEWRRPVTWTVRTKLTVWGSATLLVLGFLAILLLEWRNARTLGPLDTQGKVLAALTQSASTRTGGFNTLDMSALNEETVPVIISLMFIGGGNASTAGGIKVLTFFLLAFVVWAELRGEPDVVIARRRIAPESQRQAATVALLAVALVVAGTMALIAVTKGARYYAALFEVVSAFSTTGLSTGLTPTLGVAGDLILIILMYVGRVGTITLGTAIALNTRKRLYRYPEERPLVN